MNHWLTCGSPLTRPWHAAWWGAASLAFGWLAAGAAGQEPAAGEGTKLSLEVLSEQTEPSCVRLDVVMRDGKAIGSGFIVEKSDWVVTNYHVVAGALKATATFADETKVDVTGFLAHDKKRDVAVLRIDKGKRELRPLRLAEKLPRKGEAVVAIGAPQGLSFTLTEGIISGFREGAELKTFGNDADGNWLQTSTPISPGSSGGPLLNMAGEVVGANSASLAGAQNLNFAISAADIALVLKTAASAKLQDLAKLEPLPESRPAPRPRRPGSGAPAETVVCRLPAERKFTHRYQIAKEEDEFDKITMLRTQWIPLEHNDRRLATCGLRVGVPYKEDSPSPAVIWELGTTAKSFTFLGPGASRFQILVDGESVDLGDARHGGDVGRGGVTERLTTLLTIEGFLKIIVAKEVKARVGALEYKLSASQLEALRDLACRLPTGETDAGRVRVERYALDEDPTVPAAIAKKAKAKAEAPADSKLTKVAKEYRTWTSADGKFKVEARLVSATGDTVELERKDNGQKVKVPLATLSKADQEVIEEKK